MANNRLYVGNKNTAQYMIIAKGDGHTWSTNRFDSPMFEKFITDHKKTCDMGWGSDFVMFTEYDDIAKKFFKGPSLGQKNENS